MAPLGRAPTATPGQPRSRDPDALAARDFDDLLRAALESGGLRVLQLNADWTLDGTRALLRFLRRRSPDSRTVHLDRALLEAMQAVMRARNARPQALAETDAQGPEGRFWPNITAVARKAAETLANDLFPAKTPTLLLQPGLLARYQLEDFLRTLVERTTRNDGASVLLVVPCHDEGGTPEIRTTSGSLPIAGILPGQRAWIPRAWIENRHAAPA
jgi:hypothetical protein